MASDVDFDPDSVEVEEDEGDDRYVRLAKTDVDKLRKQARKASELSRDLSSYRRQDAIRSAGLAELSDAHREALAELVKDPTPEALRAKAEQLGFIAATPEPPAPSDAETDALKATADAANGAGVPASRIGITPEEVAAWDMDKRLRLNDQHPDLFEAALQGRNIDLPAGFQ